ncbi:MAG: hypothetical protein ACRDD1_19590, partial [Planctomycetia bacterium]
MSLERADALRRCGWVAAAAVVFFATTAGAADDPGFGRRTDGFRTLFAERGLQLGTTEELETHRPTDWIVVVLGDVDLVRRLFDVDSFVRAGGSVLLAAD